MSIWHRFKNDTAPKTVVCNKEKWHRYNTESCQYDVTSRRCRVTKKRYRVHTMSCLDGAVPTQRRRIKIESCQHDIVSRRHRASAMSCQNEVVPTRHRIKTASCQHDALAIICMFSQKKRCRINTVSCQCDVVSKRHPFKTA